GGGARPGEAAPRPVARRAVVGHPVARRTGRDGRRRGDRAAARRLQRVGPPGRDRDRRRSSKGSLKLPRAPTFATFMRGNYMTVGEVGRTLYQEGGVQVIEVDRGRTAILRILGTCTPALVEWMYHALRGYRGAVLVNARELSSIDAPFVQRILDHASRKHPIGLLSPP